jgi:hypothetical protein
MGKISDDLRSNSGAEVDNTEAIIIQQRLNKLFYVPPNYSEEIRMLKLQAKLKSGDRYGLHASAMLTSDDKFCYREQVLSLFFKQNQGENIKIGLKRIFEEGNFIGEKWQRLFVRGGIGEPEDMDISRFVPEYDLSYTPDAIIQIHKQYVVETKSQNSFIWKKEKGHPSGMKQLKFYMFLEQIKRGFVLVESKNDQEVKILPARLDESELDYVIERLERVQLYKRKLKKTKTMVDGICNSQSCKRAEACNMRDACFNVGIGRVRLENI